MSNENYYAWIMPSIKNRTMPEDSINSFRVRMAQQQLDLYEDKKQEWFQENTKNLEEWKNAHRDNIVRIVNEFL